MIFFYSVVIMVIQWQALLNAATNFRIQPRISWPTERLLASEDGLCCME
jgi:hypothetical protein